MRFIVLVGFDHNSELFHYLKKLKFRVELKDSFSELMSNKEIIINSSYILFSYTNLINDKDTFFFYCHTNCFLHKIICLVPDYFLISHENISFKCIKYPFKQCDILDYLTDNGPKY